MINDDRGFILTEGMKNDFLEDFDRTFGQNAQKHIRTIEDLVLVHKSKFMPKGIIKPQRDFLEVMSDTPVNCTIAGKEYSFFIKHERNTVHFVVNGEVTDHDYGNFSKSQYIIIIPGEKIKEGDIYGGQLIDIWSRGSYPLPDGSYIICPLSKMEETQNYNSNCIIYGYEGEYADGYGNLLLSMLGYKVEHIGIDKWVERIGYEKDGLIAINLLMGENGIGLKPDVHMRSQDIEEEKIYDFIHINNEIIKIIKQDKLITNENLTEIYYKLKIRINNILHRVKEFATNNPGSDIERFYDVWIEELKKNTGTSFNKRLIENLKKSSTSDDIDLDVLTEELAKETIEPEVIKIIPDLKDFILMYNQNLERCEKFSKEEKEQAIENMNLDINIFFFSDFTQELFYKQLEDAGISFSKEQKELIQIIMSSEDYDTYLNEFINNNEYSMDFREYIKQNRSNNRDELIKKILGKAINDKYLNCKKLSELDEEEKELIVAKIDDEQVESEMYYISILVRDWRTNRPIIGENDIFIMYSMLNFQESMELLEDRLEGRANFTADNLTGFNANFGKIKPDEKMGEYITRLKLYYQMIQEQIDGDKEVDFNSLSNSVAKNTNAIESNVEEVLIDSYCYFGIDPQDLREARKNVEPVVNTEKTTKLDNIDKGDTYG